MIPTMKTKQDLLKTLANRDIQFTASFEVVNDADLRAVQDKAKGYLRQNKKLHLIIIERD